MIMHPGERWHCSNASCRCTVLVEAGTPQEGENPRCSCGAVMKKEFKSPVFSYLDFLQFEPPPVTTEKA